MKILLAIVIIIILIFPIIINYDDNIIKELWNMKHSCNGRINKIILQIQKKQKKVKKGKCSFGTDAKIRNFELYKDLQK